MCELKMENRTLPLFKDDCINYCYVYHMKNKNEALDMFKLFITKVEKQFNRRIKRLRSDMQLEYEYGAYN